MQSQVSTIEHNVQTAHIWLQELSRELDGIDQEDAWVRLRAVLQTLRDRLGVEEAAALAAQLPTLIRGLYFESWHPIEAPHKWRHKDEYIAAVSGRLKGREYADPEATVRAVLKVLGRHIDRGELEKVKTLHNKELRDLWPEPEEMH